jgi:hypothetical protein
MQMAACQVALSRAELQIRAESEAWSSFKREAVLVPRFLESLETVESEVLLWDSAFRRALIPYEYAE